MRIAIDGSPALGIQTGIGKYTFNLIKQLKKIDKKNDYVIYLNYIRPGKIIPFGDEFKIVRNPLPSKIQRFLQNKFNFPIETFTGKIDLFHSPCFFMSPTKKAANIITIHDLTFILQPGTMIANDADYYQKYVPIAANNADHIITISNSSKKDLVEHLNIAEQKISVTYVAASEQFKPIENEQKINSVTNKYQLPNQFLLAVSTLEPRKNFITPIKALSVLKQRKQLHQKLVVVGGSGWKNKDLFDKIKELKLENDIIFPGYIGQEDLPALYNACSVFLFPSLYEGFGIPPLEALSCGKACICSNSSSIPEVVGDAAILIEPLNVEQWAEEIARLMNNPAKIKELGEKGLIQASKFSWKKMAEETLAVYKKTATNA